MTRTNPGTSYLCLLVVLLAACGSNTSQGSGADAGHDAGAGTTIAELPGVLAPAVCEQISQCVSGTFLAQTVGGTRCEEQITAQLQDKTVPQLTSAQSAGTLHYHPEKLAACLAGIKTIGCELASRRLNAVPGCAAVFEATIDVGKPCDVSEACTGHAYCKKQNNVCPGTCTALGAEGDSCNSSDECQDHLTCNSSGTCEKPGAAGAACGLIGQASCALGLMCAGADTKSNTAGQCKAYAEVFVGQQDATCNIGSGSLCEQGLSCIAMVANLKASFTCARPVAQGAVCHFGIPSQCPDGQYCNADLSQGRVDGKCVALPKPGEACLASPGPEGACAPGLSCAGDSKCRALGRIGDVCTSDSDCGSDHCYASQCEKPVQCKL